MLSRNYLAIYAKSFNWAGFFLPKKTYKQCSVLYDFCRVADNIADDENGVEVRKDNFIKFRNNFVNKNYDDPIIKNMWDLMNEFNISFLELSLTTLLISELIPSSKSSTIFLEILNSFIRSHIFLIIGSL